jgi:hypothetical protein
MAGCPDGLTCLNDGQLAGCLLLTDESASVAKALASFCEFSEKYFRTGAKPCRSWLTSFR